MKRLPRKARSRMGKPDRVSAYEDRRWPRYSRELSVLYEDDAVVVLDKPAGLLAVPIKGADTPSALSLLVAKLKLKRQRALVVHRIDRFASGALLFAKSGPDRDALVRQFLDHTPESSISRYCAAVSALRQGRSCTIFDAKDIVAAGARQSGTRTSPI
jgi:23S rRNA pseudouridine1911/1915/1917 synthase